MREIKKISAFRRFFRVKLLINAKKNVIIEEYNQEEYSFEK